MVDVWEKIEKELGERKLNFIAGEWLPCYFAYKDDTSKLMASMGQVRAMAEHKYSDYVIDKLFFAKKALDGRHIGYCSQWMDKAFCVDYEPSLIEDEKVKEFVLDNLGWFRNLVVVEEGFDTEMNILMRTKARCEGKKFLFDEKLVEQMKKNRRVKWGYE